MILRAIYKRFYRKEDLWTFVFRKWLKSHLEENGDIINYYEIMDYLKHHMQEDIGSWEEKDVKDKVKDWYIRTVTHPPKPSEPPKSSETETEPALELPENEIKK